MKNLLVEDVRELRRVDGNTGAPAHPKLLVFSDHNNGDLLLALAVKAPLGEHLLGQHLCCLEIAVFVFFYRVQQSCHKFNEFDIILKVNFVMQGLEIDWEKEKITLKSVSNLYLSDFLS